MTLRMKTEEIEITEDEGKVTNRSTGWRNRRTAAHTA